MIQMGQFVKIFIDKCENYQNLSGLSTKPFDPHEFFSNPIGYYPGSGNDGFMVERLNKEKACNHFVYVDYLHFEKDKVIHGLKNELNGYKFRGYVLEAVEDIKEDSLLSGIYIPSVAVDIKSKMSFRSDMKGFAVLATFKRNSVADSMGNDWFKILIISGDGIATYDALFTENNGNYPPPLVVLIEDYSFGENYDKFGRGGLLEKIVQAQKQKPRFVIFGHAEPWVGYSVVPGVAPDKGGMHNYVRTLYSREIDSYE